MRSVRGLATKYGITGLSFTPTAEAITSNIFSKGNGVGSAILKIFSFVFPFSLFMKNFIASVTSLTYTEWVIGPPFTDGSFSFFLSFAIEYSPMSMAYPYFDLGPYISVGLRIIEFKPFCI